MGWIVLLSRLLVGAALLEFLLLRFTLRLGPLFPPSEIVTAMLSWASQAGLLFLNVSVMAGLALLAVLLVVLWRDRGQTAAALLWAAAALALGMSAARLAGPHFSDVARGPGFILAVNGGAALVVLLIAASGLVSRRGVLPLATLGVAYCAALLHYAVATASLVGAPDWGRVSSLALAEAFLLLVGPAAIWALRPSWQPMAALTATAVALFYLVLALVRPWTASALAIWDFGFTSFLPPYVYAVGFWMLVYAVLALAREGRPVCALASMGLLLVALGGLRLDYAHYSILALVGMLLLAAVLTKSDYPKRTLVSLSQKARSASAPADRAIGATNAITQ